MQMRLTFCAVVALLVSSCRMMFGPTAVLALPEGETSGQILFGYWGQEQSAYRIELQPDRRDATKNMTIRLTGVKAVKCLNALEETLEIPATEEKDGIRLDVPQNVELFALECPQAPSRIEAEFQPATSHLPPVRLQQVQMRSPAGHCEELRNRCEVGAESALLDNGAMRLRLNWRDGFRVSELYVYDTDCNVLSQDTPVRLFVLKVGERIYDCQNTRLLSVKRERQGLSADFEISEEGFLVTWRVRNEGAEVSMSLEVRNQSDVSRKVMTIFPSLEGLRVSTEPQDDFYLFPHLGGIISDAPCHRREAYGYAFCLFGMMDIFSPKRGGGFYLRQDDPKGCYKHFNLLKGGEIAPKDKELMLWPIKGRIDLKMHYGDSLKNVPGISLAIDYIEREIPFGESTSYPAAALGGHAGDWHEAMRLYAEWSKRTWIRHRELSPLANVWNIAAGKGTAEPLCNWFRGGPWQLERFADLQEINGWWTVSERNDWGQPITEKKGWVFQDPVTKKLVISYNRGDYDGYNPQWGGLPALRRFIEDSRNQGLRTILYSVPMVAHSETKLAKAHCPDWCVTNPEWHFRKKNDTEFAPKTPEDIVLLFNAYRMCMENPDYQDWVVENLLRAVRETDADGLRLDEFGSEHVICLSKAHKHWQGYCKGHPAHQRVNAILLQRLRDGMDKDGGEDKILMTEFLGSDFFSANLDGALCWHTAMNDYTTVPGPVNLFRFYFPSCKVFEVDEYNPGAVKRKDWRYWLWNGVGVYNSGLYPEKVWKILKENTDAMGLGKADPLVATESPYLLANRFKANSKTIWTILNTGRNTYQGPLLRLHSAGKRYEELLHGRELTLAPDSVAAVIRPSEVLVLRETINKP